MTRTIMKSQHDMRLGESTSVTVQTDTSPYAPGLRVVITVSDWPDDMIGGATQSSSTTSLRLCPDHADEIAALLVAHAHDRRQHEAILAEADEVAEGRRNTK